MISNLGASLTGSICAGRLQAGAAADAERLAVSTRGPHLPGPDCGGLLQGAGQPATWPCGHVPQGAPSFCPITTCMPQCIVDSVAVDSQLSSAWPRLQRAAARCWAASYAASWICASRCSLLLSHLCPITTCMPQCIVDGVAVDSQPSSAWPRSRRAAARCWAASYAASWTCASRCVSSPPITA